MNNVTQSVQRALHAYLYTNMDTLTFLEDPVQIYTSLLGQTAVVPNILLKCQRAPCTNSTEGMWKPRATIELREAHDDTTEEEHFDHAGILFGLFATATVAADISESSPDPFTAFQLTRIEQGWRIDGRLWVSYLDLDLDCCTSDIA